MRPPELRVALDGLVVDNFAGGARTGYKVTHVIVPGGRFERAFEAMPDGCKLPWSCIELPEETKRRARKLKVKYTCDGCDLHVWGKPKLAVLCGECGTALEQEEQPDPAPEGEGQED